MSDYVNPYEEEEICSDPFYKSDRNCCTVVAFTQVFNCSYKDAYEYFHRSVGRVKGRGVKESQVDSIFSNLKKSKWVKGEYSRQNKITINNFIKKHPKGRFYCVVHQHAVAIIDGVLYDHNRSKRRFIVGAYRVYLEGEI